MMDCRTLQGDMDAILDGSRGQEPLQEARKHLSHCPACSAHLADVRALQKALGASKHTGMPAATRRQLLRGRKPSGAAGFAVAAAAVMLATTVFLLWPGGERTGRNVATVEDTGWRTTTVRLEFRAKEALSGVRFSLELPEGAQLEGHPGRRRLSWEDDLDQGANRLTIPLILNNEPDGELVARLEHQGRSRELRVAPNELIR